MAILKNNPNIFQSKLGTRINVGGLSGKPLNRIRELANTGYGTRAQEIAKRQRTMIPKATTGGVATTDVNGAAPSAPGTGMPTTTAPINNLPAPLPSIPQPGTNPNTDTLFPNTRMFEPQNYEGSPLYQFQVKQGQEQLAKSLAARGLTDSGYGIKQELNIPMMAAAQDTDRMTRIASENADRLYRSQQDEALARERAGQSQWDRAFSLADLMARESPWNTATGALDTTASVMEKKGNARANSRRARARRVSAGGGGGGGGVPAPVPTGGPDYSNINPAQIGGNYSSNNGWLTVLQNALAGFLNPAQQQQ